mgnify:FL=1
MTLTRIDNVGFQETTKLVDHFCHAIHQLRNKRIYVATHPRDVRELAGELSGGLFNRLHSNSAYVVLPLVNVKKIEAFNAFLGTPCFIIGDGDDKISGGWHGSDELYHESTKSFGEHTSQARMPVVVIEHYSKERTNLIRYMGSMKPTSEHDQLKNIGALVMQFS